MGCGLASTQPSGTGVKEFDKLPGYAWRLLPPGQTLPLSVVKEKPGSRVPEHIQEPGHGLMWGRQTGQNWGTLSWAIGLHGYSEATQSLEVTGVREEQDSSARRTWIRKLHRWKH